MSGRTKFQENGEVQEQPKEVSEQAKRLDQATTDPEAAVERQGDYQQAEQVENAFKEVVQAAETGDGGREGAADAATGDGGPETVEAGDGGQQGAEECRDGVSNQVSGAADQITGKASAIQEVVDELENQGQELVEMAEGLEDSRSEDSEPVTEDRDGTVGDSAADQDQTYESRSDGQTAARTIVEHLESAEASQEYTPDSEESTIKQDSQEIIAPAEVERGETTEVQRGDDLEEAAAPTLGAEAAEDSGEQAAASHQITGSGFPEGMGLPLGESQVSSPSVEVDREGAAEDQRGDDPQGEAAPSLDAEQPGEESLAAAAKAVGGGSSPPASGLTLDDGQGAESGGEEDPTPDVVDEDGAGDPDEPRDESGAEQASGEADALPIPVPGEGKDPDGTAALEQGREVAAEVSDRPEAEAEAQSPQFDPTSGIREEESNNGVHNEPHREDLDSDQAYFVAVTQYNSDLVEQDLEQENFEEKSTELENLQNKMRALEEKLGAINNNHNQIYFAYQVDTNRLDGLIADWGDPEIPKQIIYQVPTKLPSGLYWLNRIWGGGENDFIDMCIMPTNSGRLLTYEEAIIVRDYLESVYGGALDDLQNQSANIQDDIDDIQQEIDQITNE